MPSVGTGGQRTANASLSNKKIEIEGECSVKNLRLSVLCLLALLSARCVCAQTENAAITGRITDPTKAVVIGAQVVLINTATNARYEGGTNSAGSYVISAIPPGSYRAEVGKPGFKTIVVTGILLHVQDTVELNFEMALGAVSESVTVTAGEVNVNTTDASVGTLIDRQLVQNIPLNGRSFQTLILLAPGVALTPANYSSQGQFSVNGQRSASNYFSIDGVSANIGVDNGFGTVQSVGGALPGFATNGGTNSLVSVDAMQEFQIQTSTFAPEFGRTPGGQVSIVTRSGTNQFHGTAFEYFRNDVLDANDWFNSAAGLKKPAERQNDFGGVVGGPIIKDRTFFFFSYEGLRLRQPQSGIETVPNAASRQNAAVGIQPLLNAYPLPNGTDFGNGTAQFTGSFSAPTTLNATSLRLDHNINAKLVLFGRYNYAPSNSSTRAVFGVLSDLSPYAATTQTLTLGTTWILNNGATNEFRFNYSRGKGSSGDIQDNFGGATPPPDSLLFPSPLTPPHRSFYFSISNFGFGGTGPTASNAQHQLNFTDSYSFLTGRHHLKLGTDIRRISTLSNPYNYNEQFYWFDLPSALTGISPLAIVGSFQSVWLAAHNYSFYVQDTWKTSSRLTLTFGVRWDINPAPRAENGLNLLAFDSFSNLADLAAAAPGKPVYNTTYDNFAPRIGGAYQLSQRSGWETVLRGGWGIFYDLGTGIIGSESANAPFAGTNQFSGVPFPFNAQQAAPPALNTSSPFTTQVVAANPHLVLPRTYEWNATFEQSLGKNQVLSLSYVGALGRDLLREDFAVAPNANFASYVGIINTGGNSSYDALQLQFRRHIARGFEALGSYTYSHAIDTSSVDANGATSNTLITNPNDNRGSSDFDIRHNFTGAFVYNIPIPHLSSAAKAILENWGVDAFFTARSAIPVDLKTGQSFGLATANSGGMVRPDLVLGQPLYLSDPHVPGGRRFNPLAFTNVPVDANGFAARQGTLGRNVLRGFGVTQLDFGIHRQFNLTEALALRFQGEFFNIFNHPNFGTVDNCLCGYPGLFGQATSTLAHSLGSQGTGFSPLYQIGGPRSIQLALKLIF
jgi:hypothetical protein